MAQGWTPGPWRGSLPDETLILGPDGQVVATVLQDEDDYARNYDRRAADARLIAAAPDMATALAEVIAVAEGAHPAPAMAIQKARAALSAARGDA